MKKIILVLSISIILLLIVYLFIPSKVAVLGYHSIIENRTPLSEAELDINKFEKQIKFLKKAGFKSLTLDEMECYMNKECKIGKKSVLITFDDGYLDNYKLAFPILKKYNFHAVIFLIGSRVENGNKTYFNKKYIEKTKEKYPNIEFASHSYNLHDNHTGINGNYDEYIKDIKKQKKIIDTKYYAYPYGEYNDEMVKALKDSGYELAFGYGYNVKFKKANFKDNKYAIPRLAIDSSMPLWKFKLRMLLPF